MLSVATRIEVVGNGRMGNALVTALRAAGWTLPDPAPRGADGANAEVVLLAVPDDAIAAAAALIAPGRMVGHLSGATTLAPLAAHQRFSLHPLTTITAALPDESTSPASVFAGVYAAVAGSDESATELATALAAALGMRPFDVVDGDRAAYHAAASIASNFLVTVEGFAERLAATAGVPRAALVPLVTAAVKNWAALGAEEALTGPIARGDVSTVQRQRAAVAARMPEQTPFFDALTAATAELADRAREYPDGGGSRADRA